MTTICPSGKPKKKDSAPPTFDMDTGVFCTVFQANSVLCKFLDFIAKKFFEFYKDKLQGFVFDSLVDVVMQTPSYKAYAATEIGRFEMGLMVKAKKLYNAFGVAQDVLEALDSLTLERFDTEEFCANIPPLNPKSIKVRDIIEALNPFGDGFERLLDKVTINWAIIKFGEYCECGAFQTQFPPNNPPQFRQIQIDPGCLPAQGQADLDIAIRSRDLAKQRVLAAFNSVSGQILPTAGASTGPQTFNSNFEGVPSAQGFLEFMQDHLKSPSVRNRYPQFNDFNGGYSSLAFLQAEATRYFAEGGTYGIGDGIVIGRNLDPSEAFAATTIEVGYGTTSKYLTLPYPPSNSIIRVLGDDDAPPPCNCELRFDVSAYAQYGISQEVLLNAKAEIVSAKDPFFTIPDINLNNYSRVALVVPEPYLAYTNASCPFYITISDDDIFCRDYPDLCNCKKKSIELTIQVATDCGETEPKEIIYTYYEGSSCEELLLNVANWQDCNNTTTKDIPIIEPPLFLS